MKKLNLFLGLGALSLAVLFTSCKDDEPSPAPVISFDQSSPYALEAGEDSVILTGVIKAEGELKSVAISKEVGSTTSSVETITDFDAGAFTSDDKINCNFRYGMGDITAETKITFEVTDKEDQTTATSITVTVTPLATLSSLGTAQLGAGGNLTLPSYYAVSTDQTYSLADARTNADILDIVFTSTASIAKFISPKDASDATINAPGRTTLYASTSIAFADITAQDVEDAALSADNITVAQGDVVIFETEDDARGVFEVTQLTIATDGSTTIDIKVKQ